MSTYSILIININIMIVDQTHINMAQNILIEKNSELFKKIEFSEKDCFIVNRKEVETDEYNKIRNVINYIKSNLNILDNDKLNVILNEYDENYKSIIRENIYLDLLLNICFDDVVFFIHYFNIKNVDLIELNNDVVLYETMSKKKEKSEFIDYLINKNSKENNNFSENWQLYGEHKYYHYDYEKNIKTMTKLDDIKTLSLEEITKYIKIIKFRGTLFECVDEHDIYIVGCNCKKCFDFQIEGNSKFLKYGSDTNNYYEIIRFTKMDYQKFKNYKLIVNEKFKDIDQELKKIRENQLFYANK